MKFVCNQNNLQESISIVQKAITNKSTMPILEGILLKVENNTLTLIGSDIDLSIETKINVNVFEEGSVVIDSRIFGDIVRKLPDSQIEIFTTEENNTLNIICEKSKFSLLYMDSNDFPSIPAIDDNMILSIAEETLKNMIKGTIFSIADDETRPVLTGVLFEIKNNKLNLVALDGFRLAFKSENINSDNELSAIIPGKTLSEVSKILEDTDSIVNITFTKNHILFNLGDTKVISRLLEGEFINYNSIIPDEYNLKVITKRIELLECIERASLLSQDGNTKLIKLNIEKDNIIITSNSQLGKVKEELNVILQGEPLEIAFNSKYLIECLKVMEEEEIIMELSSNVSPCIIKNKENDNCTYLVLPVRLSV